MINFINIQCTKHEPLKKLNGLKGDSKMNSVSVFSMGDDLEIKETEQFFIDLKNQLPPPTISIFLTIKMQVLHYFQPELQQQQLQLYHISYILVLINMIN